MSILNKIFPTEKRYVVTTSRRGAFVGEVTESDIENALKFLPELSEDERKRFEDNGVIGLQKGTNSITVKEFEVPLPPQNIYEARLKHSDPEMEEYHDERHNARQSREMEKERMAGAPYAVGWDAQSLEWYGDDHPGSGRGRYKPKGDGGRVVAINIPSYQEAAQVEREIEEKYRNGNLDPAIEARYGDDHYILHYHGPWIKPMSELDEYDKINIKHDAPEDYSQHGA